jgi:hypothetical protein
MISRASRAAAAALVAGGLANAAYYSIDSNGMPRVILSAFSLSLPDRH